MEIYELIERDGDYEGIVYLNSAHIVEIVEDDGLLIVHMSNGKAHQMTEKSAVSLRTLLHASKSN